jgi:hypothetical protein
MKPNKAENGQGIKLSQQLYKPNAARNFVKKLCKKKITKHLIVLNCFIMFPVNNSFRIAIFISM